MVNFLRGPGFFRLALSLTVFVDHVSRFNLGTMAVFIFFSLSGYWIFIMWNSRYSKTRNPYITYLVSRCWRLLPVFGVASIFAWLLVYMRGLDASQLNDWEHQAFSSFFIFGYHSLSFKANGPAWSLDIEMQFYLLAPFLISIMMRNIWIIAVCAGVSAVATCIDDKVTVAPYLIFFSIGAVAARLKFEPKAPLAAAAMFLSVAIVTVCVISPYRGVILGGAHRDPLFAYNPVACVILTIGLLPVAFYTTRQRGIKTDHIFADLSYIIYLIHWPVIGLLAVGEGQMLHRFFTISEALLVTVAVSILIWRWFDKPINQLRSRWVASRIAERNAVFI